LLVGRLLSGALRRIDFSNALDNLMLAAFV